jgi:hypothetical protein
MRANVIKALSIIIEVKIIIVNILNHGGNCKNLPFPAKPLYNHFNKFQKNPHPTQQNLLPGHFIDEGR